MALLKQRSSELPPGAVRLSKTEAIDYQFKAIESHYPESSVYFLKYGPYIMALAATTSGFWLQRYFRTQFFLKNESFISTMLPTSFLPGIASHFWHVQYVLTPIVLQEQKCPVCLQLKAAAVHTCWSVGWPLILAPIAAVMAATRSRTFYVPNKLSEVLKVVVQFAKPATNKIFFMAVLQFAFSVGVVMEEQREFILLQNRRLIRDEHLE